MSETSRLRPETVAEIYGRYGARGQWKTRGSLRFPLRCCNAIARRDLPAAQSNPFEIEIADVAVGGIGFCTRTPISDGTLLTVQLEVPGMQPQTWRCRVVNVRGFDGEHYRVGPQFYTIPSP